MTAKTMRTLPLLACAALLAVPVVATADTWLILHGGGSTYSFDTMERRDGILLATEESESGAAWGGALAWDVGRRGLVGLGYERLQPGLDDVAALDRWAVSSLNLDAEIYRAFAVFRTPRSAGQEFGVGAAVGWLRVVGSLESQPASPDEPDLGGDLTGDDVAAEFFATVDAHVSPQVALHVAGGWRTAMVDNLEVDDRPLVRADHHAVVADYTGFFGRVGLKVGIRPWRNARSARETGGVVSPEVGFAVLGSLSVKYFEDNEGADAGYLVTAGWRGGQVAMGFGLRDDVWQDLNRRRRAVDDGRFFAYLAYHPYDLLSGPYLKIEPGVWERLQWSDVDDQGQLRPFLGLGSGYRQQVSGRLGIYLEGMTISRAGDRPVLEARLGTSILLGT